MNESNECPICGEPVGSCTCAEFARRYKPAAPTQRCLVPGCRNEAEEDGDYCRGCREHFTALENE